MIIKNGLVFMEDFKFRQVNLKVIDGMIQKITDTELPEEIGEEVIDARGLKVIPGLTDIHFHGCMNSDLCDATDEAISTMAKYQRSKGVTTICPATMTLPKERLMEICQVAANHERTEGEAEIIGINLEGPFISPAKVGAQNPEYVHRAEVDFLKDLIKASDGLTKLVTIAPEEDGALECISALKDDIKFSIGHTSANYEEAVAGIQAGVRHMTHMFNAMPGLTHRVPGPIAAAAERPEMTVELICDGYHIHPSMIRLAFRLFGPNRIVTISDSCRACGMEQGGEYELGGQSVYLNDGVARLKDGTIAASATNLFDCMVNTMKYGIPEELAVRAATYNPVKAIGMEKRYGSIAEGKVANLVLVNEDYEIQQVIGQ